MKKLLDYLSTHKYLYLLLYWPVQLMTYGISNLIFGSQEVLLFSSPLDLQIPFCEWFVIPYVLWFPYIIFTMVLAVMSGKKGFLHSCAIIYLSIFIPMTFCLFVPNGIPIELRPDFEALGRNNPAIWLVKFIYLVDSPPRNCMPSIHVSVSCALFFTILTNKQIPWRKWLIPCSFLLSTLICAATVLIKQHSILDVYYGVIVAVSVFAAVMIVEFFLRLRARKKTIHS
jgi:membrane-associated phospholipid phosphatase